MGEDAGKQGGQRRQAIIAVVALAAVLVVASVGYGVASSNAPSQASDAPAYDLVQEADAGMPAAEAISSCTIATFDNEPVQLGQVLEGKITVLNLWATWCPHCVEEVDDFQRLYDEYGDRVQFVMVDVPQGDMREYFAARDFIADNGYTLPTYFDMNDELIMLFGVRALPMSIILSDSGQVLMNRLGSIQYDNMKSTFNEILGA